MALSSTLTVSPTAPTIGTGSDVSFVATAVAGQSTERLNSTTDLSTPEKLVIKHSTSGQKTDLIDRHLVQLSRVEQDVAGVAHTCIVNVTISVPRNALFSTAEVERQVDLMSNFLCGSGVVAALLQGQS